MRNPVVGRWMVSMEKNQQDAEEYYQEGITKLWQDLQTNPNLLADKCYSYVNTYIFYGGRTQQRRTATYKTKTDTFFNRQHQDMPDTRTIDFMIDLERAIHRYCKFIESYEHENAYLAAVYYILTNVDLYEAMDALGFNRSDYRNVQQRVYKAQKRIREYMPHYRGKQ